MSQYVAIIQLDVSGYSHTAGGETVFEPEPVGPKFTGLYNSAGQPLFRVESRNPIGFELKTRSEIR